MAQVVGLDIGTSAVRAAEIDIGSSGPPKLVAFGQVGLPPGAIVDGEVQDRSAVTDAIRRLWENGRFVSRSVVVGIAGLRAITRELDLPWVPDSEIDSAVRFQSEEVIPFPPDKTILSAQVLGDHSGPDGQPIRRVLVAAAHRDLVEGVVAVAERAELQVEGVDLLSSALVRALTDPNHPSEQPEAIVSVGAGLTVIVVHQRGRPQFVRTVDTGGNAATSAISAALDIPLVDAEAMKRRLHESSPQVHAATQAVQASIAELTGEIRSSIQYFASLPGRAPIARVLLTGGGSRLKGLLEQLQAQVGIPVQFISPLARLNLSSIELRPEQMSVIEPVLAAPIGLALPESSSAARKFNLVPPEVLQRSFVRRIQRYTLTAAAVVVILLFGVSAWRFLQVHQASDNVSTLTQSVASLNAQIPKYSTVVAEGNELRTAKSEIASASGAAVNWAAVLTELGVRTPPGLVVTQFSGAAATGTTTTTATTAATTTTPGSVVAGAIGSTTMHVNGTFADTAHFSPVAQWIDGITASPLFDSPGVTSVTNTPSGAATSVSFQSTLSLKPSASLLKDHSS